MFKRVIAFIILLGHMNSSMFLPQVAEQDIYDANGQQEDDINTVAEYVYQVILGHHDNTPEDEDDDSGQNFHLINIVNYCYEPFFVDVDTTAVVSADKKHFISFNVQLIPAVSFEILSPPPDIS